MKEHWRSFVEDINANGDRGNRERRNVNARLKKSGSGKKSKGNVKSNKKLGGMLRAIKEHTRTGGRDATNFVTTVRP